MSDLTLYRKYRPQTFDEIVGQDHLIPALQKGIAEGAFAHAYLFSGSRGTGKTSVARILARELKTDERDLYEIDAASNRGIDDIRALREEIQTLPFSSPYKVYILDEVHMLSREAFNALLKTLEEPPQHALFILATTELHKVPDTIRSRCQLLSFKTPSEATLAAHAISIAKKEGYTLKPQSAELIALLGEGSYRDTLGALQKVLQAADEKTISHEVVEATLGAPRIALINALIESLSQHNGEQALVALTTLTKENVAPDMVFKLLVARLRAILLMRTAPSLKGDLEERLGADSIAFLEPLASDKGITSRTLLRLLEAHDLVRTASTPMLPLELAVIDLTASPASS